MQKPLLFVALVAIASPAGAQHARLTLDSARAAARASHPEIRAARADARAARATAAALGRLDNPVLSVDHESARASGVGGSELIVALEQPLDIWGRRTARGDAALLRAAAADARAAATLARIEEEATLAFTTALAAGWQAAVAEDALAAFDRATRIAEERRDAGDISGLDARRLQLERTRAVARLAGARHERHVALTRLAALIGVRPASVAEVTLVMDTLPDFAPALPVDSLQTLSRLVPSELLARELEHRATLREVAAAERARIPVPRLRAGAKWESNEGSDSRSGLVAGIALPLPLWNGGGAAVGAAVADADAADAALEATRRAREVEVLDAWEGLHDHVDAFRQVHQGLTLHGDAVRSALDVAYAEGELTLTEWLDALRTAQETASLHAELWTELAGRLARLERLTGLDLFAETP
jgi:cobalt-zinc-cadmium efflux system outer membrane protein